jgi:hypothetical protein
VNAEEEIGQERSTSSGGLFEARVTACLEMVSEFERASSCVPRIGFSVYGPVALLTTERAGDIDHDKAMGAY